MKGKDIAYIAATLAAGFVAFRVYKTASSGIEKGAEVVTAIKDGAVKVITQDLNPASDKNIVYQGVSAVTPGNTGSFGSWLYDVLNPDQHDPTAPVAVRSKDYDSYDLQNVAPAAGNATIAEPVVMLQSPEETAFSGATLPDGKFDKFIKSLLGK